MINLISDFGGKITDAIIEKCQYLNIYFHLKGEVMADRGFKHVESLLQKKGCRLIRS